MGKCLITKLNESVNNDNLLKIGEFSISLNEIESPSESSQKIQAAFTGNSEVRNVNGNFTDSTLSNNTGKNISITNGDLHDIYVKNVSSLICFGNKYGLRQLFIPDNTGVTIDISELKFCPILTILSLGTATLQNSVDIASITNLSILKYSGSSVIDTKHIKNLPLVEFNAFRGSAVTGDVANIPRTIKWLTLDYTKVYGEFIPSNYPSLISTAGVFRGNSVYGDISKIGNENFITMVDNNSKFSWKTERNSSYKILAIEGIPNFGEDLDAMLINQAKCVVGFTSSDNSFKKAITARGTKTSASDAAVATLQQKGYTVLVIPA